MTNISKAQLLEIVREEAVQMFHQLPKEVQHKYKNYLQEIQQATTTKEIRPLRKGIYLLLKQQPSKI